MLNMFWGQWHLMISNTSFYLTAYTQSDALKSALILDTFDSDFVHDEFFFSW